MRTRGRSVRELRQSLYGLYGGLIRMHKGRGHEAKGTRAWRRKRTVQALHGVAWEFAWWADTHA
eukprot:365968-Chlamydomonas_euryale.AAC.16